MGPENQTRAQTHVQDQRHDRRLRERNLPLADHLRQRATVGVSNRVAAPRVRALSLRGA